VSYFHWLGADAEAYEDDTEYTVSDDATFEWVEADGFTTIHPDFNAS
jgi:hypothetical protein